MTEITAQLVMELRNKTGAKMMDAKRALVETEGNLEAAVALLREKGQAEAGKRTHRIAAEGSILSAQSEAHDAAALVELNCETDFVAKTDQFVGLAKAVAQWALAQTDATLAAECLPEPLSTEIKLAISKTGENLQFKRGVQFTSANGVVEAYLHLGGKIGVLVQVDGANNDVVRTLAKDLAMQVAAASPDFLTREDVPEETIEKEKEIYRQLARNEGKAEQFLDRIAEGRLEKFFKDTCLIEQAFVKDPDKQIKALLAEIAKAVGAPLTIKRFVRFQLGQ